MVCFKIIKEMTTLYQILDLANDASPEEIRIADKNSDGKEMFQKIGSAYEIQDINNMILIQIHQHSNLPNLVML